MKDFFKAIAFYFGALLVFVIAVPLFAALGIWFFKFFGCLILGDCGH